ncbi:Bac_rhamnosid-domain-containing protein [Fragilariopsis cylindrus CCMP1102]|uniref:alpha-L-rhamnosidase n=1 Tax=Fragilariopsis cylindrus CCMP1102 TaxID=635003 RepID=A0A1E7FH32_9STRA|nr:Bac_rhamnosid-domain-containing protein [Fragilariopsis cylindrus CCMP1102]|eukprot:OEU17479.1 Bac_rhamnosid-domain-containing protein [Fragilariopsis cylindrus CCMP1102]
MVAITLSARAIQGNNTMHFGRVEWDKETEDKGTNIEYLNIYNVQATNAAGTRTSGSIIPYELSINHLKLIAKAPGAPPPPIPSSTASSLHNLITEDFLPVVTSDELVFRWRHRAKVGSKSVDIETILAHRIIVRLLNNDEILWDSGRLLGSPDSIHWKLLLPLPGNIAEWCVEVWDSQNRPYSSEWSKFAIGPDQQQQNNNNNNNNDDDDSNRGSNNNGWIASWIAHPTDMDTFDKNKLDNSFLEEDKWDYKKRCKRWKLRNSLPLFRAKISTNTKKIVDDDDGTITSALLVVSGLGSFRVSFDGIPLSTSGPIDPAFTDYTQRVSYRGFDVTPFLRNNRNAKNQSYGKWERGTIDNDEAFHVIGITTGSGWYDPRPLGRNGVGVEYKLLPNGPITIVAQLYVTTSSGMSRVVAPTGIDASEWQVSRGHIRESDLFTGETVDLNILQSMEGWDTPEHWSPINATRSGSESKKKWVDPVLYQTDVTFEAWHPRHFASPIGKLIPSEIPPVLPMERLSPDEIFDLGSGRWLFDFGKAISGMLHFDEGLPIPIVPKKYPRGHSFKAASTNGDAFVTIIYGESLEMTTGDINRVLTAGFGLHDGGPRHLYNETFGIACFPDDQDGTLSQRDTYVVSSSVKEVDRARLFKKASQSHFTTHAFRFAEICCSSKPPATVHALMYRTAFDEWGNFDSSNILINGGYELVKNAMNSNMLSVQSDCPHREKLPYGGDLVASSPTALHMFDMSAFYRKSVRDWMDGQWENGAYTETSMWQDLNDYAGIGHGAGETVWASAPPVLTVRHMQMFGDISFLKESLPNHIKWLDFLDKYFDKGMKKHRYDDELKGYDGNGSGLSDWLGLRNRDTFLTHTGFYMASARSVAYIAKKLGMDSLQERGMTTAKRLQDRINKLYFKNGKDDFDYPEGRAEASPGPDMGLFARIVPGEKRCKVLRNLFKRRGNTWPGNEERRFLENLRNDMKQELITAGELIYDDDSEKYVFFWSQWRGFNEGIFGVRYILKALSESGFHNVALGKANGKGFATFEYMLRHNATSMWESWWRSESLYSRNHPMLGAMVEWMPSSVAGLSLHPTTSGGRKVLFWPQFPKSAATLEYASAMQGSPRGDFALAWEFNDLPEDRDKYDSALVSIRIRLMIPPGGEGALRLPLYLQKKVSASIQRAQFFPDQWYKLESSKAIGTPCRSFLFHPKLSIQWEQEEYIEGSSEDCQLGPGLYQVIISGWQLEKEAESEDRIGQFSQYFQMDDVGPYCSDPDTFEWDIDDATHII